MIIRELFEKEIDRPIQGVVTIGNEDDKQKKQELEDLRKQMDRDNHLYLFAVEEYEEKISKLSQELTVQRNVAKTLGENNQRLLKSNKDLKNCQHPNDETIAYMVSLYGNWVDRSAEDYHLSPSEFIKKYWR